MAGQAAEFVGAPAATDQFRKHCSPADSMSEAQLDEFRSAFALFDTDKSGQLDVGELRELFKWVGLEQTEEELQEMLQLGEWHARPSSCSVLGVSSNKHTVGQTWWESRAPHMRLASSDASMPHKQRGHISLLMTRHRARDPPSPTHAHESVHFSARVRAADSDGSGTIDVWEFATLMAHKKETKNMDMTLREAFSVFDGDGDGTIGIQELKEVMSSMGERDISSADVAQVLNEIDVNHDGKVDYHEFSRVVTSEMASAGVTLF